MSLDKGHQTLALDVCEAHARASSRVRREHHLSSEAWAHNTEDRLGMHNLNFLKQPIFYIGVFATMLKKLQYPLTAQLLCHSSGLVKTRPLQVVSM
mmetsp:Transcript_52883/g.97847  ORF Transcript_52883/g.97847 Transcript_52883/m.97847 type:complete len:96 (+) Transcript_52883:1813-2100(+)